MGDLYSFQPNITKMGRMQQKDSEKRAGKGSVAVEGGRVGQFSGATR
jgi:hypothetical protein